MWILIGFATSKHTKKPTVALLHLKYVNHQYTVPCFIYHGPDSQRLISKRWVQIIPKWFCPQKPYPVKIHYLIVYDCIYSPWGMHSSTLSYATFTDEFTSMHMYSILWARNVFNGGGRMVQGGQALAPGLWDLGFVVHSATDLLCGVASGKSLWLVPQL